MSRRPKGKKYKCLFTKPGSDIIHYKKKFPGYPKPIERSAHTSDWDVAAKILQAVTDHAAIQDVGISEVNTLGELLEDWFQTKEGEVSFEYRQSLKSTVTIHFGHLFDKPLGYFRTAVVRKLRTDYLAKEKIGAIHSHKKNSAGGANTTFRQFRTLFLYALEMDYITRVPFRLKRLRRKKQRRPFVRMSQLAEFLAMADKTARSKSIRLAIRLMLGLGLRLKEVRTARWEWIDWDVRTYTPNGGKSGGDYGLPIMGWLFEYLLRVGGHPGMRGLMIQGRTMKPVSEECRNKTFNPRKTVNKAGHLIGIDGLTNHRLRGTFATLLGRAGVPLSTIQVFMRHEEPTTTNIYMEKDLDRLEEAALRFQAEFQKVCPGVDLVTPVLPNDDLDEEESDRDEGEDEEPDEGDEDETGEEDGDL